MHPFGEPIGTPFPIVGQVVDKNDNPVANLTVSVQNLTKTATTTLTTATNAGGYYSVTLAEWDPNDALSVSVADTRFGSTNNARRFPYIRAGETEKIVDIKLRSRQLWEYITSASVDRTVSDISRAEINLENLNGQWTSGGTTTTQGESFKQGDKVEVWILDPDDLDLRRVFLGFVDQQPKTLEGRIKGELRLNASSWVRQWHQVRVYDIWENMTPGAIMADILKELTANGTFDGGTDIDNGTTSITKYVSDGLTVFENARRLATIDSHYFGERWDRASAYDRKPFFKLVSGLTTDPTAIATDAPVNWNVTSKVQIGTTAPQRVNAIALKGGTSGSTQYTIFANDYPDRAIHGLREAKVSDQSLFSVADLLTGAFGRVEDSAAVKVAGKVEMVGDIRDLLEKKWQLTVSKLGLVGYQVQAQRYGHKFNRAKILRNSLDFDEFPMTTQVTLQEIARRVASLEQGQTDAVTIPINLVKQDNTYSPANWLANVDNIAFYTSTALISTAGTYAETTKGKYAVFTGDLAAAYGNGVTIASVMLRSGSTIQVEYGLPRPIAKTASKSIQVTASVYTTT